MEIVMFTKMLKEIGNLTLEEAGDYILKLGFDGADLTVRERGYVPPENVVTELPKAINLLNSKGLNVPLITTSITDVKDKNAEDIIKKASECQVQYIKLGYWLYAGFGNFRKQIQNVRNKIKRLYRLGREYDVTLAIHTHAGNYLTNCATLLYTLLEGYEPRWLCAYIDPGHLFAETGPRGWELGLDILAPYIRVLAVKNYRWIKVKDVNTGNLIWKNKMLPLKEEIVNWPAIFKCLKEIKFDGCISLHSEYKDLDLKRLIDQTSEDLEYLKNIIREVFRE